MTDSNATSTEPILMACEGSGCRTHAPFDGEGMCCMCGQWTAVDEQAQALPHRRQDIIAMVGRGDFG